MNIYRFFIAIIFIALRSAVAQMCVDDVAMNKIVEDRRIYNGESDCNPKVHQCAVLNSFEYSADKTQYRFSEYISFPWGGGQSSVSDWKDTPMVSCPSFKPDLAEWENCQSGKDHGFSWVTIGDAQGEGESRYKQEFWSCDDPDIWITYDHPPEEGPDSDGGSDNGHVDGSDGGSDNGHVDGSDGGSDNGHVDGSDGGSDGGHVNGSDSGSNLTKQDITDAITDAISCSGANCSGLGVVKGNVPSNSSDSIYESRYSDQSLSEYIKNHPINIENTKLGLMINSFIPVLPAAQCPVWSLPNLFDSSHLDVSPPCWIFSFIKSIVIIGALFYARRIILGA